ncbi:kinase-like domain-containing protein [Tribonema minus]|uniref:Kinase-like domain-containing protein n=1 Tax=Tribonema minus TaxID=303371 RepID=A0A836CCZ2_9STRA|nr:kinase-like domain-containing protein [Tribonema minus]
MEGVFSMDCCLDCDDSSVSQIGTSPSVSSLLDCQSDKERLLRLAFTEYHNNGALGGNSSAFLGDKLSFHNESSMLARAAAKRQQHSTSCGVLLTPALERAAVQPCGSAEDDDYCLGYEAREEGSEGEGSSAWGYIMQREGESVLKPLPAGRDHACEGWVTPCLASRLAGLFPPARAAVGPESSCLNAASFNPARSYQLDGVQVAAAQLSRPRRWEARTLVLRQNFLLEYRSGGDAAAGEPIGFGGLSGCCVSRYEPRIIRVELRPSVQQQQHHAGADAAGASVFFVRASTESQADAWQALLTAAAQLSLEAMYEFERDGTCDAERPSLTESASQATLGHGRFACVKKARARHSCASATAAAGASCAVKIFDKAEFWRRVEIGQERADTLVREAAVQAALSSSGGAGAGSGGSDTVVQLRNVFETRDTFVVEMELMSRSNLFHELARAGVLSEREAAPILQCLLRAVAHCQARGIAHRDIKLSNILCPAPDGAGSRGCAAAAPVVKLGDFGMAGAVGADGCLRGRCGTPGYVAPEILRAGPHEPYGANVDAYSVGVVAYTLLCGYEPFYGETDAELLAQNKAGDFDFDMADWCDVSLSAQDFVSALMDANPATRITAAEALEHPWLAAALSGGSSGARRCSRGSSSGARGRTVSQDSCCSECGGSGGGAGSSCCTTEDEEEDMMDGSWLD